MATLPRSPLHPVTQTFHRAFYFIEYHLPKILFAVALPTILSLLFFWIGFGVTFAQITETGSFAELAALFSWGNPNTYMLILLGIVLLCVNIIGLIAAPLVMVEHERIRVRDIIPRSLPYFFAFVRLLLLILAAMILLSIISYLIVVIISSIVGFINIHYLDFSFNLLSALVPNAGLVVMAMFFMFAPFALIQQGESAYQALMTSALLVRQNFWPLIVRLAIVIVCVLLIGFLLLFIPYVGYALSFFVSALVMTIYNFVLYEDMTGVQWR